MKKAGKVITDILAWVLVLIAVCVMIFTVVSVNTFDKSGRTIFGYSAFIVMSDSMSKTDFDAGDVILVKGVEPSELKEGDIIAYESQDNSNYGETVTHKIRRLTVNGSGEPGFVTYGTTTGIDDEVVVTYPYVLGKYEFRIPKIGTFFHFLKTPLGYVVCILIPFAIILGLQIVNMIKAIKDHRAVKTDALKAERLALEEERRQMEEKLKELQALEEQMRK
ncbi:MAG: signal peptidase I [Lachnospiraceae bacterium]|nr:signal peptidase I [Lachnospiraceae bacterium]